ncbi:MAG: hypothetical protein C4541_08520 [Candidatus Auribacter fodinae]|uniref:Uncharacterized protein n=1 Tax=Candidatus Auribacter fodinae TaxID=2093366 RepID=A0A3A4QWB0_9BACT|nr:MAG: hypothetical protein C4541_08520 [Candidatus Auribacter fodinae]
MGKILSKFESLNRIVKLLYIIYKIAYFVNIFKNKSDTSLNCFSAIDYVFNYTEESSTNKKSSLWLPK